jgi:UDP-glucose 4-epimerase
VLKKSAELIGSLVADSGVEVVNLRISTVWDRCAPHEPPFAALPALVRTGVPSHQPVHTEGGRNVCYVKDVAYGIALLQVANHLNHRTYNVADGRATSNGEVVAAIRNMLPGARDPPARTGRTPPRQSCLTSRSSRIAVPLNSDSRTDPSKR